MGGMRMGAVKKIGLWLLLSSVLITLTVNAAADDLYTAATPIVYGEEVFLEKLEKSEREQPLGLVLSGGSARAFAHIGVLQYLEEQGIIPDFIVANSMGSIVGLLYSAGLSPEQMYQLVTDTDFSTLFSMKLPTKGGLLDVSAFSDYIFAFLGDLRLEELEIPIIVVCEDLVTKRTIHVAEGDFYEILEASFALPVYFDPIKWNGHRLIDGGITNLLHLGIAYAYTDEVIVSTAFYDNPNLNLANPITILNVSIDIAKRRAGVEELISFDPTLIRCAVEEFSFMDFSKLTEIYEAGYDSAAALAGELQRFEPVSPSDNLQSIRSSFDRNIPGVKLNLDRYNFIPAVRPHGSVELGLVSYGGVFDETPLYDELALSLGYRFKGKTYQGEIGIGTLVQTREGFRISPVLLGQQNLYPHSNVEVQLTEWIELDESFALSSEVVSLKTDVILFHHRDSRVSFETEGVASLNQELSLDYSKIAAGLRSAIEPIGTLSAGYFLENFDTSGIEGELSAAVDLFGQSRLQVHALGSLPFDFSKHIEFFPRDAYRLNKPQQSVPYKAGGSVELLYSPKNFTIKAAELLVIDSLAVGLYGEMLTTDSLDWGAGAAGAASLSLIGIESTTLTLYGGYSSVKQGPVFGFTIGTY